MEIEKGEACFIKVAGVAFTKSLNDAKSLAAVTDGRLIFKCRAKKDNFNDPDGKLFNSTAPVLLTKIVIANHLHSPLRSHLPLLTCMMPEPCISI